MLFLLSIVTNTKHSNHVKTISFLSKMKQKCTYRPCQTLMKLEYSQQFRKIHNYQIL